MEVSIAIPLDSDSHTQIFRYERVQTENSHKNTGDLDKNILPTWKIAQIFECFCDGTENIINLQLILNLHPYQAFVDSTLNIILKKYQLSDGERKTVPYFPLNPGCLWQDPCIGWLWSRYNRVVLSPTLNNRLVPFFIVFHYSILDIIFISFISCIILDHLHLQICFQDTSPW